MKILHVIPSVAKIRGGPSQAVLEMVQALLATGIEAEIVTTNDNGTSRLPVQLQQQIQYQQVPIRFFNRFSPPVSAVKEFAFSGELTEWLKKNIRCYDLIHVHAIFSYASTAAMAIARAQGVPYIVRPLGQLCQWSLQQSALKKQLYLKIIERDNLAHSSGLHFTSLQEQQEADSLQLNCPGFVVPHGLTFSAPIEDARSHLRQKYNLPANEPIILFLSRIHPKKGLELLIPALGSLKHHPFTFILAGSGDPNYESEIHSLIESSGMSERTILPGFVEGDEKDLLLQGADLFSLTSHSENFGVAALEALAAGLPALMTPGVALSTEVEQHGLGYVTALSHESIVAALKKYFSRPAEAKKMGNCARQFAMKNYTWEKNAENLVKLYRAVLNSASTLQSASADYASDPNLQRSA